MITADTQQKNRSEGMTKVKDITGQKFGRLTALERAGTSRSRHALWKCKCECGKFHIVSGKHLRSGEAKSCGCLNTECRKKNKETHGMARTRLYRTWVGIKARCINKNAAKYPDYGGRGITVCDEWKSSFEAFRDWALANGYRDDLTIDRKDNDGPYSPENCRWASMKVQENNKRNNRMLTLNGETHTIEEWATKAGMNHYTLRNRLRHGWSIERALTAPVLRRKNGL